MIHHAADRLDRFGPGRLFISIVLGLLVASWMGSAAHADSFTESFDSLDPALWSTFTYGNPGPFIREFTGGELRLKKSTASGGNPVKGGGLGSRFRLRGDFTITVDFRWSIFAENNQAQINISQPGVGFRYDMGIGKGVDVPTGSIIYYNFVPADGYIRSTQRTGTTDTQGTLRLLRRGSVFTAYFRSPGASGFTQIPRPISVTSADINFQLILQNNYINNVSEVFYDNLVVEADSILGLPQPGAVIGSVLADCPGADTPLLGVPVDLYDLSMGPGGTVLGDLVAGTVTDQNGNYEIPGIPAGNYLVTMQEPLGYAAAANEIQTTVTAAATAEVDFALACIPVSGGAGGAGFWKHQVGAATNGKNNGQIDAITLCGYLDELEAHFNSNQVNQVLIYEPPLSGLCADKLEVARELLNLKGNVGMTARARQQLMALLLNVAAGNLSLVTEASSDGATVSQAITYCDNLLDDPDGDHETAKDIAETINQGGLVSADVIPLETAQIAYRRGIQGLRNAPNPFAGSTTIRFAMARPGPYEVFIFTVTGRLVRSFQGVAGAGETAVTWNGLGERGEPAIPGVYFYRVRAGGVEETRRMVLKQ